MGPDHYLQVTAVSVDIWIPRDQLRHRESVIIGQSDIIAALVCLQGVHIASGRKTERGAYIREIGTIGCNIIVVAEHRLRDLLVIADTAAIIALCNSIFGSAADRRSS